MERILAFSVRRRWLVLLLTIAAARLWWREDGTVTE